MSFFSDLGYCCWSGGLVCQGGAAEMGAEDDPQIPRSGCERLHSVLERWAGFQCHHSQKQVTTELHTTNFIWLSLRLSCQNLVQAMIKKCKCRHRELVFANHNFHSLQINCLLDFKLVLYFSLVNTLSWLLRAKIFQILGSDHSDHVNLNGHQENCMQSAAKIHIWNIMSACPKFGESWNEKFSNMNDVVTILVIFYNYHLILAAIANIHICVYYHLITGVTYSQELSRPTIITWS